jgi:hypothetical protein
MLILSFALIIGVLLQTGGLFSGINTQKGAILIIVGLIIEIGGYFIAKII